MHFEFVIGFSVLLIGEKLNPVDLTNFLNVKPDRTRYKGQQITTSTGNVVTYKEGLWAVRSDLLKTNLKDETLPLLERPLRAMTDKLQHLEQKVRQSHLKLSDLSGVTKAYADYFVYKSSDSPEATFEFELPSKRISWLNEMGLAVNFYASSGPFEVQTVVLTEQAR